MAVHSSVNQDEWEKACLYVLHNTKEMAPFFQVHMAEIRAANPRKGRSEKWIQDEQNRTFREWIRKHLHTKLGVSQDIMKLSRGPSSIVTRYTSYLINGNSFYTRDKDEKHPVQNSGVTLRAESMHISSAKDKNPVYSSMNYYGFIEDIWELDYCGLRIPLFKCKWADNSYVKVDSDGVTVVDFRRLGYKNDPFIMASQAVQVFYTTDPANLELSLVLPMKSRIIRDGQEDIDDFTDIPSFTMGLPPVEEIDNFTDDVSHLLRLDVEWTRVENPKKKTENKYLAKVYIK